MKAWKKAVVITLSASVMMSALPVYASTETTTSYTNQTVTMGQYLNDPYGSGKTKKIKLEAREKHQTTGSVYVQKKTNSDSSSSTKVQIASQADAGYKYKHAEVWSYLNGVLRGSAQSDA